MHSRLHLPCTIGHHSLCNSVPIAGDASGRQYWRVQLAEGDTAVLCRYPESMQSLVGRDLEVLLWLGQQGLRVPHVMVGDARSSWVLLEDAGKVDGERDLRETPILSRPQRVVDYLQPLIQLSALPAQRLPPWNPPFDNAFLRWELAGFEMWGLPDSKKPISGSDLSGWLDDLARTVAGHPQVICLRDFHLNNILVNDEGEVGIIDVQDLRRGPDTYDLASLLADRAMPELLDVNQRKAASYAWAAAIDIGAGWQQRLQETTLQRSLKVLGTFAFLQSKGLHHYQRWVPKTASAAAIVAKHLGAPAGVIEILLELTTTGGVDVR